MINVFLMLRDNRSTFKGNTTTSLVGLLFPVHVKMNRVRCATRLFTWNEVALMTSCSTERQSRGNVCNDQEHVPFR